MASSYTFSHVNWKHHVINWLVDIFQGPKKWSILQRISIWRWRSKTKYTVGFCSKIECSIRWIIDLHKARVNRIWWIAFGFSIEFQHKIVIHNLLYQVSWCYSGPIDILYWRSLIRFSSILFTFSTQTYIITKIIRPILNCRWCYFTNNT